jgi:hypothetical protein
VDFIYGHTGAGEATDLTGRVAWSLRPQESGGTVQDKGREELIILERSGSLDDPDPTV